MYNNAFLTFSFNIVFIVAVDNIIFFEFFRSN